MNISSPFVSGLRPDLRPTKANMPTRLSERASTIRKLPNSAELPHRVLLVAGDNIHTHLIRMVLLNNDIRIVSAQNSTEVNAAIAAELPHLVLLDWDVDGIDGRAILRAMKTNQETRKMPVLVITNRTVTEGLKLELGMYGVRWILEKPIVPLSLPKLIVKMLSGALADQAGAICQRKAALIACGQSASGVMWKSVF